MKVLVCGKNDASINITKSLQEAQLDVLQVFLESERNTLKPFENFASFASNNESRFHILRNKGKAGSEEFQELVQQETPDLVVCVQFSVILNKKLCDDFAGKIINIHFSPLPYYRGVAPISHAILNGEPTFGVTVMLVDSGIDTGPIIAQKIFDIRDLNNFEVYRLCTKFAEILFKESLPKIAKLISEGNNLLSLTRPQEHKVARYFSKRKFDYNDNILDGDGTAYDMILKYLAFTFPPLNYARIDINGNLKAVSRIEALYDVGPCIEKFGSIKKLNQKWVLATRDFYVAVELLIDEK